MLKYVVVYISHWVYHRKMEMHEEPGYYRCLFLQGYNRAGSPSNNSARPQGNNK